MLRLPWAGCTARVNPVGVSAGNMQALRSIVVAVLSVVLTVQVPGAGTPTERFSVTEPLVPALSTALMVTAALALGTVGVPLMTPVPVLRLTPVGSDPLAIAKLDKGGLLPVMVMGS